MGLQGRTTVNSQRVEISHGKHPRDAEGTCGWRVRSLRMLLNARSDEMRSEIAEGLGWIPVDATLGALTPVQEVKNALRAMANNKAVGPDDPPAELLKLGLKEAPVMLTVLHGIRGRLAGDQDTS